MAKCSYCNKQYSEHKGTTVVDSNTGTKHNYCSSKCRKNSEMKRKKRKWTNQKNVKNNKKEEK